MLFIVTEYTNSALRGAQNIRVPVTQRRSMIVSMSLATSSKPS